VPYAVLESTSHALALRKLLDCEYDVAILTNITHDHIDFHGSFEQYREDKARLFGYLKNSTPKPFLPYPKTAIVNADDPNAEFFLNKAGSAVRQLRYGIKNLADITATEIVATASRLEYNLNTPQGAIRLNLRLPGEFNVYNSMAAAAAGLSQGLTLEEIKTGLESVAGVPGRMEIIEEGQSFSVVVDYCHTPDSMTKVLKILRPLTKGRLLVVFGSAGERDIAKRPMQGEVAARLADFAVFSNEDPRLEDENKILDEIAAGAERLGWREHEQFLKIADRRAAIEAVVARAQPGDTILLAGKGHEQCIIIGTDKTPWDERDEARRALRNMLNKD
jgi:UDP-N-acetylmuramoyl-L-alanyl-D-glutamate--2,6-diaminopimelate ligase